MMRLRRLTRRLQRLTSRLHDGWYWVKCRLWHRYNVVVCRSLPPTWHDRDYLLLYAAFQCLEDFVEKEEPWEFTGDVYAVYLAGGCTEEHAREEEAAWKTVRELYAWWETRQRADECHVRDDYNEDSRMLHKLIDIRGCLWT